MENSQNRNDLYKAAPANIQDLYSGEETGELLWRVSTQLGMTGGDTYRAFALAVGDVILGMYKKESLEVLLQQRLSLTAEQTKWIRDQLEPLLNKLPNNVGGEPPTVFAPPPSQAPPPPPPPPTTVKPMRTFQEDFDASRAHSYGAYRPENDGSDEDEPVHRSNQDDIIRK